MEHVWIRVTDDRPSGYPRGGVVYSAGRTLRVPETAAVAACEEANPPFAERVGPEEAEDLEEAYQERQEELEGDAAEEPAEEPGQPPGNAFTPAALQRLHDHGVRPEAYDGPATGVRDKALVEDVEGWLEEELGDRPGSGGPDVDVDVEVPEDADGEE